MKQNIILCRTMAVIFVFICSVSFSLQASPLQTSPLPGTPYDLYDAMDIAVNDSFIKNSPKTAIINGIDYIPLSRLQDNLGIKVTFQKDDGGYHIYWWSNFLYINIGKNIIRVNNEYRSCEYAPEIINDILYVPRSMLVDIFGFKTEKIDKIKAFRIITRDGTISAEDLIKKREEENKPKPIIKEYDGPKAAYITFDDGIVRGNSEKILDILKEKNVKATFFILGNTISKNQDILKRMAEEGHSIGNHSYSHRREIIYSSSKELMSEVERTSSLVKDTVGEVMNLFRPPYGSTAIKRQSYKKALENYKIVMWNVDSNDSRIKNISAEQIYRNVVAQVKNKRTAIILFHETKAESVKALPMVIDYLIRSGFEIKAIDENTTFSYK